MPRLAFAIFQIVKDRFPSPWGVEILAVAGGCSQQLLPKSNQSSTSHTANQLRIRTLPHWANSRRLNPQKDLIVACLSNFGNLGTPGNLFWPTACGTDMPEKQAQARTRPSSSCAFCKDMPSLVIWAVKVTVWCMREGEAAPSFFGERSRGTTTETAA